MAGKVSAKNAIVLVNGYKWSTYATAFSVETDINKIEVTGFGDACKNYIPGMPSMGMKLDMFWDSTASIGTATVMSASFINGAATIIPEGYALGNRSLSMPFSAGNFSPQGKPDGAILLGSIDLFSYGANVGLEDGYALQHGTITATTTGLGFDDPTSGAVTASCGGTLHIWSATTTDTYVIKIQHSTALGSGYADLITFSGTGTTLLAERQTVASGTVNRYRRILATRTGSAGDTLGFTVVFYHN